MSLPVASPVATDLAAEIEVEAVRMVEANREEIIETAADPRLPWWKRKVLTRGLVSFWPSILALVPLLLRLGVDLLLTRIGQMTLEALIAKIMLHRKAKGLPVHPTLAAFASQHNPGPAPPRLVDNPSILFEDND